MTPDPSPKLTLLIWVLLFTGSEPSLSQVKPKISPQERAWLETAGLIRLDKRGRFKHIVLTDKAWGWAADHLDSAFSHKSLAAAPALGGLLRRLKAFLEARELALADFLQPSPAQPGSRAGLRPIPQAEPQPEPKPAFQPPLKPQPGSHAGLRPIPQAGPQPESKSMPQPRPEPKDKIPGPPPAATVAAAGPARLEAAIVRAYLQASGSVWGVWIKLAEIRKRLPDTPRADLDRELLRLEKAKRAILYPIEDPEALKAEDEAAALTVAGFRRHIILMRAEG